jgi:hypothetical protein
MGNSPFDFTTGICNSLGMEIRITHIIILCTIWILGAIAGIAVRNRNRTINVKYKHGDAFKKADPRYMAMPHVDREIKFNIVYSGDKEIPQELLCDLTINLEDILNGTYRIPEMYLKKQGSKPEEAKKEIREATTPQMDAEDYGNIYYE